MSLPIEKSHRRKRLSWDVIADAWRFMRAEQGLWSFSAAFVLAVEIGASFAFRIPFWIEGKRPELGWLWAEFDNPTLLSGHVIAWLAGGLVSPFTYMLIWLGVRRLRGEEVHLDHLFRFDGNYFRFVGYSLGLGAIGKSIPGYWYWALWVLADPIVFLAPVAMIDKRIGVFRAIGEVWRAVAPSLLLAILIWLASWLVIVPSGLLLCFVGVVITLPMFFLVPSAVYCRVFDLPAAVEAIGSNPQPS